MTIQPPCTVCPIPADLPCPHRMGAEPCPVPGIVNPVARAQHLAMLSRPLRRAVPQTDDNRALARVVTCPHRWCRCHSVRAFAACLREGLPMPTDYDLCIDCVREAP